MCIDKLIERVTKVAVCTAYTALIGTLTVGVGQSIAHSHDEHKVRMKRLEAGLPADPDEGKDNKKK